MIELKFEPIIFEKAPQLEVVAIEADVANPPTTDEQWAELQRLTNAKSHDTFDDIRQNPSILATREAYKAFGKDPNRYRPSAEALYRRVVKGMPLYRTLTVVDLINYVSIYSGHSIGGFDADKIEGPTLTLGVGRDDEPYEAIGRGELNIAGLPVYRDTVGGVGTPTSDNERTKLDEGTRRLLMIINGYGCGVTPDLTARLAVDMLKQYASAKNIVIKHYRK